MLNLRSITHWLMNKISEILNYNHIQWVVIAIIVYMQSEAMLQANKIFHSLETPYYSDIAMS